MVRVAVTRRFFAGPVDDEGWATHDGSAFVACRSAGFDSSWLLIHRGTGMALPGAYRTRRECLEIARELDKAPVEAWRFRSPKSRKLPRALKLTRRAFKRLGLKINPPRRAT